MYKCKICCKEFDTYSGISQHCIKSHAQSKGEIFVTYKLNGVWPVCKCGCGTKLDFKYGFRDYVKGHYPEELRQEKIKKTCLKKYGTEYPAQNIEIKEKAKLTSIERYGTDNFSKTPEFKDKTKKTNLERFGVEWPGQSEEVKEKIKRTNFEKYGFGNVSSVNEIKIRRLYTVRKRYGTDCVFQNEEIKREIKQRNLEKYGVEYTSQSELVQGKIKDINLQKYGVENILQLPEIKEKIKKTNLEKYGVENASASELIKLKRLKTIRDKYGVDSVFQSPEIKEKTRNTYKESGRSGTHSKYELILSEKLNGSTPFLYKNKEYDILVGNDIIEVDGDYWHQTTPINLSFQQLNTFLNDYKKVKLITDNNEFNLHRIKVSDIDKINDINDVKKYSYQQNFTISNSQPIVSKQYLLKQSPEKLEKYLDLFISAKNLLQPTFPYPTECIDIDTVIQSLSKTQSSYLDKSFNQTRTSSAGLDFIKVHFKSFWNAHYNKMLNCVDAWEDDRIMKHIIRYRLGLNRSRETFDFSWKNLIKGLSVNRYTVSIMKPALAADIYKHFLKDNPSPTVLDPCAGFGSRMIGFYSAYPNGTYIGVDLNKDTCNELIELNKILGKNSIIINDKIENVDVSQFKYDLAFTSIPYWDTEIYSHNHTTEYSDYSDWKDSFLKKISSIDKLVLNIPENLFNEFQNYNDVYKIYSNRSHLSKNKEQKFEYLLIFS